MSKQANRDEARELSIYATNTGGSIYRNISAPIVENLARKIVKGKYDSALALKSWARVADHSAKAYAAEYCGAGFDPRQFSKATRLLAAAEIAAYYQDLLKERADLLAIDAKNKRLWPLANIARLNEDSGMYFFSRDTMRFFGDTMASFKPVYREGLIYIQRVKAPRNAPAGYRWNPELRPFDPETGAIGCPIKES